MKTKKRLLTVLTLAIFILATSLTAFAAEDIAVTLDGKTYKFSCSEIEKIAKMNNVDPIALKEAIESGPDEDGRFSPFSKLKPLDNGVTKQELDELNKQKMSSTGVPLIKSKALENNKRGYIARTDQDTTAYNWTGYRTANGNWPVLGIVACHRQRDIYGGSSYAPVIPFGKQVYLDRYVWLPDGVGYKSDFYVDDTGAGPGKTDYWLDIYYHNDTASAIAYGNIVLNYNQQT